MKVIQVSSGVVKIPPEKGGAVEEHIVKLSLNLKNYCDVKIVDRMYSSGNIYRIDGVNILRIKVSFIYLHSRINHIINEFLYSKKLTINIFKDADIIHAHNVYVATSALKIARKVGAKFVYTCHNGMWCSDKVNLYEKYLIRRLESKIMREADVSIAVSQNLKENIIQKGNIPEEKLVVVYNGVDTNFFNPNIDCSDILTQYNLEDSFVVLFVGRVAPVKGLEYLIKAANLLKDQPIKFLIVGPFKYMFHEGNSISNYAKLLLNLVRKYDLQKRVIFTDAVPRSDLPKFYAACDVFVLPSVYEAMGMVLVEAMSAGKPLIGSKVGGIPEIIKEGKNGLLFEPMNFKKLAEMILILMEDEKLRSKMGKSSRKMAEDFFSWENISKKVYKIYKNII